jgi:hypothetical protein
LPKTVYVVQPLIADARPTGTILNLALKTDGTYLRNRVLGPPVPTGPGSTKIPTEIDAGTYTIKGTTLTLHSATLGRDDSYTAARAPSPNHAPHVTLTKDGVVTELGEFGDLGEGFCQLDSDCALENLPEKFDCASAGATPSWTCEQGVGNSTCTFACKDPAQKHCGPGMGGASCAPDSYCDLGHACDKLFGDCEKIAAAGCAGVDTGGPRTACGCDARLYANMCDAIERGHTIVGDADATDCD